MPHGCVLVGYAFLALLIVLYASAVVVVTVNVMAGAAMNIIFFRDHRRPDGWIDLHPCAGAPKPDR